AAVFDSEKRALGTSTIGCQKNRDRSASETAWQTHGDVRCLKPQTLHALRGNRQLKTRPLNRYFEFQTIGIELRPNPDGNHVSRTACRDLNRTERKVRVVEGDGTRRNRIRRRGQQHLNVSAETGARAG